MMAIDVDDGWKPVVMLGDVHPGSMAGWTQFVRGKVVRVRPCEGPSNWTKAAFRLDTGCTCEFWVEVHPQDIGSLYPDGKQVSGAYLCEHMYAAAD